MASHYGVISEGFVVDAVTQVERHGWESWLLTRHLEGRDRFSEPPDDRIRTWELPGSRMTRKLSLNRYLREAGETTRPHIRAVRPDVIHAHFGWNLLDVVRPATALGTPLVATFHASDVTVFPTLTPRQRLLPGWRRHEHRYSPVFPHLQAGIAVSDHVGRLVRALGFTGRLEIIPAGIRLETFRYRPPRAAEAGDVRLLFIGRLVARKGLDVLLQALVMSGLPPGVVLEVIGDGPERHALEALATELGIASRVTFRGALRRDEVVDALERSDVLVMASRRMPDGEVEGSPVVTKEAQAVGLPVVATDNGGTRETLPPEHRHEIVLEDDPAALAAALVKMIQIRPEWPTRTARARAYVEDAFSWERLAERTVELYASVSDRPTMAAARLDRP